LVSVLTGFTSQAQNNQNVKKARSLIVIFDGLRADYITKENMPNLYQLKMDGVYGASHHSIFPTVTRVNASSYATGSYPGTNGLMGNSIYFPVVNKVKALDAGKADDLIQINEAMHGNLLTSISLGEVLHKHGEKMMVFSSGTSGQALLQNHTIGNGGVINTDLILPETLKSRVLSEIGEVPQRSKPNTARHQWITDALLKYGVSADGAAVSAIWYSDPDGTAHSDGVGTPSVMAATKSIDEQLGRIITTLKKENRLDQFNIFFTTDHGFVTHKGKESLINLLMDRDFKKEINSDDVILAGGAIYVKDSNPKKIKEIVEVLQQEKWIGAIFTKGATKGDMQGSIPGTLSFESIHWDHAERSADILVDVNWDNSKNEYGYEGASYSRGVAGHGSSSPYEISIPYIMYGPSFKEKYENNYPSSNVDLVPTLLYLHGYPVEPSMNGRILNEALKKAEMLELDAYKKETIETTITKNWGTYTLQLEQTKMGKYRYVNFTKTIRKVIGINSK
jgi:hypothetical protein